MTQTVVIGLDGGNWPLIEPWIDEGRLPVIEQLRDEGASGVSRSCLPPVTCPNWKCYASGKNPGKLGVYWWERIDTTDRSIHLPDSRDFRSPEIWDYLNDEGLSAGVINLPMSYPPREIDEFIIAGGPRSREVDYTEPPELQSELESRFDYRVHPQNVLTSNSDADAEVEMVYDLLRTRMEVLKTLLDERDIEFAHVTLFHLNVLQHYFWNEAETRRAWEIVDEELSYFLEGDFNLVLVSDHGCTDIDTVFYINRWLEENGYLTTKRSLASRLHDVGITQERIASVVRQFGLEKYIRPLIPRQIIERFPTNEGVVREEKLDMVDWTETTAIASGQGLVYVVTDDESERAEIRSALIEDIRTATGADGSPLTKEVYTREQLYHGGEVDKAPDIVFDQRPGVHTSEAIGPDEVLSTPEDWLGENVPEGMVVFHGEGIDATELDEISITDVAPTILHWLGLAVPEDMDGDPLQTVFSDGADPARRDVRSRSPLGRSDDTDDHTIDEDVQDRLQDIGYLE